MSYASPVLPIFKPSPRQVHKTTELGTLTVKVVDYDHFMSKVTSLGYAKVCESYHKGQLVGFTFNHTLRKCEAMIMRDDANSPWVLFRGTKELIALAKETKGRKSSALKNVNTKRQAEEFGT